MRTLTVAFGEDVHGCWHIEVIDECGRTADRLCFGEMLEQVAEMAHPKLGRVRYPMHTPDEWAARQEATAARANAGRQRALSRLGRIEHAANQVVLAVNAASALPGTPRFQEAMAALNDALDALPF